MAEVQETKEGVSYDEMINLLHMILEQNYMVERTEISSIRDKVKQQEVKFAKHGNDLREQIREFNNEVKERTEMLKTDTAKFN